MFLHIQDGEITINIQAIAWIDWTEGEEEASVYMIGSEDGITCEGEDWEALRAAVGKK